MTDRPRHIQMQQWCEAERKIYDAMQAVEAMAADVRLTDAVVLLGAARDRVADFVDGVEGTRTVPSQVRGEAGPLPPEPSALNPIEFPLGDAIEIVRAMLRRDFPEKQVIDPDGAALEADALECVLRVAVRGVVPAPPPEPAASVLREWVDEALTEDSDEESGAPFWYCSYCDGPNGATKETIGHTQHCPIGAALAMLEVRAVPTPQEGPPPIVRPLKGSDAS